MKETARFRLGASGAWEEHEKFISAKIARNPLKKLTLDERVQGNPSFSNLKIGEFRRETAQTKRIQTQLYILTQLVVKA
jgi:hypothetical protein